MSESIPPKASAAQTATPDSAPPSRRHGKVLLIDDEPSVLRVVARTLGRVHEVLKARTAREAMEWIERDGATIDAVICDVSLGDTMGTDLRRDVAARVPALADRFVYMTGGGIDEMLRAALEATGAPLLEKPIETEPLLDLLDRLVPRRD